MNEKEINEYLAECLFKLERCEEYPDYFYTDKTKKSVFPYLDYIENYQQVLEKMLNIVYEGMEINKDSTEYYCKFGNHSVFGNSIGEAICRAAVEYLKNK